MQRVETSAVRPPAINIAQEVLSSLTQAGASSCVLYGRDPWWTTEWRLLLHKGIKMPEPMHGFLLPSTMQRLSGDAEHVFVNDVHADGRFRPAMTDIRRTLAEQFPVYGDFAHREGVRSCVRFIHRVAGVTELMLFVNFSATQHFGRRQKAILFAAWKQLVEGSRDLLRFIRDREPSPLHRLIHILKPTQELASIPQYAADAKALCDTHFTSILDAALDAFDVARDRGYASLHLLDPHTGILRPEAFCGAVNSLPTVNIANGKGIISWVAHTGGAVLIDDITRSSFREIYVPVLTGAVTQISLPMLAGDECVGVLNLESSVPMEMRAYEMRTLCYAACQAAIAYRLAATASENDEVARRVRDLLGHCRRAGTKEKENSALSDALQSAATIVSEALKAKHCDFWLFEQDGSPVFKAGATYPLKTNYPLRDAGWTRYVQATKKIVWLSQIDSATSFTCAFRELQGDVWLDQRPPDAPPTLNEQLVATQTRCEMGVPVIVDDECLGVMWLKYPRQRPAPSSRAVELALRYAEYFGLVVDLFRRMDRRASARLNELTGQWFRGLSAHPRMECCIRSKPVDGQVGGDFYLVKSFDDFGERVGFVVGDMEGHGVSAALSAFPMFTTFSRLSEGTFSTKAVVEKLFHFASAFEMNGTVLYAIIDFSDDPILLFATSAGHDPLLLIRGHKTIPVPDRDSPASQTRLGATDRPLRLAEEVTVLQPDDLIIGFTDGVTEAGAPQGKELRWHGIEGVARKDLQRPVDEIADDIMAEAIRHADGALHDDAVVVVLRILKRPKERVSNDATRASKTPAPVAAAATRQP